MAIPKMTPEEKARADAYAAGVFSEREHTSRALSERDHYRAERDAHHTLQMARTVERDTARAEIEMLRGVGCSEDGDGPCGACLKCARRERDALSAALVKVREAAERARGSCRSLGEYAVASLKAAADHSMECYECRAQARLDAALASTASPADLAAAHDARVRAEALREAATLVRKYAHDLGGGPAGQAVGAIGREWADRLDAEAERIGGGR